MLNTKFQNFATMCIDIPSMDLRQKVIFGKIEIRGFARIATIYAN